MFLKKRKKKNQVNIGLVWMNWKNLPIHLSLTRYIIYLNNLRTKFTSKIPPSLHDDSNNYSHMLLLTQLI